MIQQKETMYESPEAARKVTMHNEEGKQISVGFLSIHNKFYNDEDMARYDSATHRLCGCGEKMSRGWTKCDKCRGNLAREHFLKLEFREWKGEVVCTWDSDKYFFEEEELIDWLEEQEMDSVDLLICHENHYQKIDFDYWSDELPEDGDIHKDLVSKVKELNKFIDTLPPLSYSPGKIRTSYTMPKD